MRERVLLVEAQKGLHSLLRNVVAVLAFQAGPVAIRKP